jgi:hypothetical protein
MMTVLMAAGVIVVAMGLAAIGFGIPVKEFSLGNTLILTGTVAVCTGLIMLSLGLVVRELRAIGRRLGPANQPLAAPELPPLAFPEPRPSPEPRLPPEPRSVSEPRPALESRSNNDPNSDIPLFIRDQPVTGTAAEPVAAAPWQEDISRDRGRQRGNSPLLAEAETKPRRSLLATSSSRRERERAALRPSDSTADDLTSAAPQARAAESAPRPTYDDAWPGQEPARPEPFRRSARAPASFSDPGDDVRPGADRAAPPENETPAPQVTILKSGMVDGMAYSLYSDGSIEAQMPEGMMRFASIGELRAHLDQRP